MCLQQLPRGRLMLKVKNMASDPGDPAACFACKISLHSSTGKPFSDMCSIDEEFLHILQESLHLDYTPSTRDVLCENCFMKISDFRVFLSECTSSKKNIVTSVPDARCDTSENESAPISTTMDKCPMSLESNECPTDIVDKYDGTGKVAREIMDTINEIENAHSQTGGQVIPVNKIPSVHSNYMAPIAKFSSDQATHSSEINVPFQVPPGTLMLKKQSSTVYILPDGTTREVFKDNSSSVSANEKPAVQSQISSTNINLSDPDKCPVIKENNSGPPAKKLALHGASRIPKPTIIITDSVPVPTLLLPPSGLISSLVSPNKNGKMPIARLKPPVKVQGPYKILPKTDVLDKNFQCQMCSEFFASDFFLREHMKIHPDVLRCMICEKPLVSTDEVIPHTRENHPRHICHIDDCNFYSAHLPSMSNHALIHSAVKDFKCPDCGQCFKTRTYLRAHIERRHSNKVETFNCHLCKKSFKGKKYLHYHLKFHARGLLSCSQCESKFQSKESLVRHQRAFHTGGKGPFSCEHCGQNCSDEHTKIRHWKTHFKEKYKSVKCPIEGCMFREFSEYRVRNHVARVHKNEGLPNTDNVNTACEAENAAVPPEDLNNSETPVSVCSQVAPPACSYEAPLDVNFSANQLLTMNQELSENLVTTIQRLRNRLQHPVDGETMEKTGVEGGDEIQNDQTISQVSAPYEPVDTLPSGALEATESPSPLVQQYEVLPPCDEIVYHEVVIESSQ